MFKWLHKNKDTVCVIDVTPTNLSRNKYFWKCKGPFKDINSIFNQCQPQYNDSFKNYYIQMVLKVLGPWPAVSLRDLLKMQIFKHHLRPIELEPVGRQKEGVRQAGGQ